MHDSSFHMIANRYLSGVGRCMTDIDWTDRFGASAALQRFTWHFAAPDCRTDDLYPVVYYLRF